MTAGTDEADGDAARTDDEAPLFRDVMVDEPPAATSDGAAPSAPPRPARRPRTTRTPRRDVAEDAASANADAIAEATEDADTAPIEADPVEPAELAAAPPKRAPARVAATADTSASDTTPLADLLKRAIEVVVAEDRCSASLLQRELGIRFVEAAALIERMHHDGVVGPYQPNGMREVLVGRGRAAAGTSGA